MENQTVNPMTAASDPVTNPVNPVAPVMPVAPASVAPASVAPMNPAPQPAPGVKKFEVLLAEDEEDARVIYMDILTNSEWNIDGAENGQVTLDKLATKRYDLLLLDIIMPDLDGLSVLAELKKDPAKYGAPKVVMLTNIGGDLAIEKALGMGAIGYMLKSETEPENLVESVRSYLEKGQAAS